jgi:hypothetical protein
MKATWVTAVVVPLSSWILDTGQNKTFTAVADGGSGSYKGYNWYEGGLLRLIKLRQRSIIMLVLRILTTLL